jgi:oligopeptide/dipeptide ABC transporter ATP-binding protein
VSSLDRGRAPALSVRGLQVDFQTPDGLVHAVRGADLEIAPGEALGLVGESGSGKSVSALAVMGLLPPAGRLIGGSIELAGEDLLAAPPARLRDLRGDRMTMVFQDPLTSLDPTMPIGDQVSEPLVRHRKIGRGAARARALELLEHVGIPDPQRRQSDYPHRLSGGTRQRVMLAMALACGPDLLIADEATSALDVTVQAQILELLGRLRRELGMALLLITHDLGVVAGLTDRVAVMYAGRVVESGPAAEVLLRPRHPYTAGLLRSMPRPGRRGDEPLVPIDGMPPDPSEPISGCAFRPRCAFAVDRCGADPPLAVVGVGHRAACWVLPGGPGASPFASSTARTRSRTLCQGPPGSTPTP